MGKTYAGFPAWGKAGDGGKQVSRLSAMLIVNRHPCGAIKIV